MSHIPLFRWSKLAQEFTMRIRGLEKKSDDAEDYLAGNTSLDAINLGLTDNLTSISIPTVYSSHEDDALEEKEATEGESPVR